jgi:SAM-dependent methyltransferase
VTDNPYDSVPYLTRPRNETHPDRLAAIATLFGMSPAPVACCRVLEIGCGDGGNVVPLAYGLPQSRVTGVDLATVAISSARRMAADLNLENIHLVAGDLREIGPEYGEFDYIMAHGVYSWVPADARGALLRVCAARLAPQGVAFISYNTYPGRHVRQMLREMMLYHTRNTADPARRMERARSFLQTLAEGRLAPPAWRGLLEEETRLLLEKDAGSFWHDDLAEVNAPVYFHEFAAHAAAHGLEYLGEADAHLMFDPRRPAGDEPDDPIEREQQLDFLRCRRFRQTLLCRSGIVLDRDPGAGRMSRFLFAAPALRLADGQIEGLNGTRIAPGHAELEAVVGALGDSYPLPLAFDDLLPYGGGPQALAEILWALARSGFATFHVHDFPCEETVSARPRASALARWQAARSSQVCSACHTPIELE